MSESAWAFNVVSPEDMCPVCKGKSIDKTQIHQTFKGVANILNLLKDEGLVSLQKDSFEMRVAQIYERDAMCSKCGRQQFPVSLMIIVPCSDEENISQTLDLLSK